MSDQRYDDHAYGRSPSGSSLITDPAYTIAPRNQPPQDQQALLSYILQELQISNDLNRKLAADPPNGYQFAWTVLLQTFAVVSGIVFGAFAILAWTASNRSNTLASDSLSAAQSANSLASQANVIGSSAYQVALTANWMATSANRIASQASYTQYTAGLSASSQADNANRLALVAYCANVPSNVSSLVHRRGSALTLLSRMQHMRYAPPFNRPQWLLSATMSTNSSLSWTRSRHQRLARRHHRVLRLDQSQLPLSPTFRRKHLIPTAKPLLRHLTLKQALLPEQ